MPHTERTDDVVKSEIESGDPAIRTGERWSRYEIGDGANVGLARLERQLLIIARHPLKSDHIVCEDVGNTYFTQTMPGMSLVPEYNLRKLFRPDGDWKVSP